MKRINLAVVALLGCAAPEARDPSTTAPIDVAIAPMASAPPDASSTPDAAAATVAVVDAAPPADDAAANVGDDDDGGDMFGDTIGEAFGAGGLGLTGVGDGGGGRSRTPKPAPKIRAGAFTVNGALPPEVVQRIVRQNFGRFRLCYESGLRKNAKLEGSVSVRFTIETTGNVSKVSNGGSTLADPAVVACVVRAFGSLSFPQPESGTVTVRYPITFAPK